MRALLRSLRPDSFDDITAVIALYRPGPMGANAHNDYADRKNGRKPVVPIHPELDEPLREILDETYGLVVYQEQVMAIARKVAGYSLATADLLRRAMGKKKKKELEEQYENFSAGMAERGLLGRGGQGALGRSAAVLRLRIQQEPRSRATPSSSYWTAMLKANYPAEYMAALLTSVRDDKDKSAIYLAECRRMGIRVLPPCVNSSDADFTPTDTDIRFGLTAIRNVGTNVVASIVSARKAKGAYEDFGDFLRKVEAVVCNKRTIESLIKGGAFDSLGHPRRGLMNVFEPAVDAVLDTKRAEAIGQFDLFGEHGRAGRRPASRTSSPSGCPTASGTRRSCCSSSARCWGCTSPTTRCSASSTCWPAAPT